MQFAFKLCKTIERQQYRHKRAELSNLFVLDQMSIIPGYLFDLFSFDVRRTLTSIALVACDEFIALPLMFLYCKLC